MLRVMLVAALVVTISACANNKPNPWEPIDISGYTKVTEPQIIEMPEALGARRVSTSWADVDQDMGIIAGNYVSFLEGPTAVLYLGKGRTNYWLVEGQYLLMSGGIWVPKNPGEAPKLFWLIGEKRTVKAPTLEAAIKLQEPPPISDGSNFATSPMLFLPPPTTGADVVGTGIAVAVITAISSADAELDGKIQTYTPLDDQEFSAKLSSLVAVKKPVPVSVSEKQP